MNFASLEFFAFLALVYAAYRILPHRGQNLLLLGASYFFYACWDWRFLGLIWLSTVVDYVVGKQLAATQDERRRRWLLAFSLAVNLGMLGIFKYFGFFADSLQGMLRGVGMEADWRLLNIVLPVGISFYTFQTLSYTIDIFRRKLQPTENFADFALFVAFFPQLVAGPIERASRFLPQIAKPRQIDFDQSVRGCYLIVFGLFKKIAIADGLAGSVDAVFNSTGAVGTLDIVLATVFFAFQIYCDFSGYSDIARGVAKLLGFELMVNFRFPYFAGNPQEFWRRWHISLSSWLRDYLYVPLGGNRGGTYAMHRNLMLTMTLGGLWHGASWNFVLWGIFQGGILCVHRLIAGKKADSAANEALWLRVVKMALFFPVVCYGWLLFRATSLDQVAEFTRALTIQPVWGLSVIPTPPLAALAGMILLGAIDFFSYRGDRAEFYLRWPLWLQAGLYASLVFVLLMGLANERSAFIYFQF